jgi:hypothetical protein
LAGTMASLLDRGEGALQLQRESLQFVVGVALG